MTTLRLSAGEPFGLGNYLHQLVTLDSRAVVRIQAGGTIAGVWAGPPFQVVALRPVELTAPVTIDATVSAQRLNERLEDAVRDAADGMVDLALPSSVPGPSWVGLLPSRGGWEERGRASVAQTRASVDAAKQFFRERADGVTDRDRLDAIAADVWQRACVAEVPVRAAHAAESLGLLGPGGGEVTALEQAPWLRLRCPGGSVMVRREVLPGLGLVF